MSGGAGFKVALVGESGAGKGTYLKELLKKNQMPVKCISTRNDWGFPIYYDFDMLMNDCMGEMDARGSFPKRVKSHVIIIDEAQVWLPHKREGLKSKQYRKFMMMLANCRADNNVIIFVMHGFEQMPVWMPTYIQGVERFYTSENLEMQIRRFPQFPALIESFKKFPVMELHERKYIKLR